MNPIATPLLDPVALAVLHDPRPAQAITPLRVALAVLAIEGAITIDASAGDAGFVSLRRPPPARLPAHTAAVHTALASAAANGMLSRSAAQGALARAFGSGFAGYTTASVLPSLVAGGLASQTTTRLLGLFTRRRTARTAAGDLALARLAPLVAELDALPQWLASDPPAALRLARAAGPLLLLSAGARRALAQLRTLAPAAAAHGLLEDARQSAWLDLFEHAEALLSIDTGLLLTLLDALADFADGSPGSNDGSRGEDGVGDGGDGGGGGD
jgi:hypothetical protein